MTEEADARLDALADSIVEAMDRLGLTLGEGMTVVSDLLASLAMVAEDEGATDRAEDIVTLVVEATNETIQVLRESANAH